MANREILELREAKTAREKAQEGVFWKVFLVQKCTDEEFIRRAYLDLLGILPTPEEVKTFLASTDKEKRSKLRDELLQRQEAEARDQALALMLVKVVVPVPAINAQLKAKEAAVQEAEGRLQKAGIEYRKLKELHARQAVAQEEVDKAAADVNILKAQLKIRQAEVEEVKARLQKLEPKQTKNPESRP